MDWFQAFTLLMAAGHRREEILEMAPAEFRGYLRAAVWLRNKTLTETLHLNTLAASAGMSGSEAVIDQITDITEKLKKAHTNV